MKASRASDFSTWYNEVAEPLASHSPVRGCMIIKPHGYAIWERMQRKLDEMFKDTGHSNAYFPLLIPMSYLNREAAHVAGFAKECAVVTHYRLHKNNNILETDPSAILEEPFIIRPTSETIIWQTYKQWIRSYRDLPILLNQWCNVMRWEMRTRLFLRTTEFLWQEGHTAHATREEAETEAKTMLEVYRKFMEEELCMPVLQGVKSESERFAGACETYCVEALMQDGKALQAGTSHFLGQNFAKAFDVQFTNTKGRQEYVWGSSWGVSTRLMGGLIMVHSDDQGLVLPPRLAPIQVVIIPIYRTPEEREQVDNTARKLQEDLKKTDISVKYDSRDTYKPGWKFAEYEKLGVPIRLSIGPRDLAEKQVELTRRDTKAKIMMPQEALISNILEILSTIQKHLYQKAHTFREKHTYYVDNYKDFCDKIEKGGWVYAPWDGKADTEALIKHETKATLRCLPLKPPEQQKPPCVKSGDKAKYWAAFAKAY